MQSACNIHALSEPVQEDEDSWYDYDDKFKKEVERAEEGILKIME